MRTQRTLALMAAAALASAVAPGMASGQTGSPQEDRLTQECPEAEALRREVQALRSRLSALEGETGALLTEAEASRLSPQLTGTVDTLDGRVVWLRDEHGDLLRMVVNEETVVGEGTELRQGERGTSSRELAPGMEIRARTEQRDGERVAKEVEILPPPEPGTRPTR